MKTIKDMAKNGYADLCSAISNESLEERYYHADDYILRQGQTIEDLYWVDCGTFSMDYTAENGRRFSLGNVFVDEFILGELEFLTNTPCQFSVVATDTIKINVLPRELIIELLSANPNIGIWLSKKLSESYQTGMKSTMDRFLQPLIYSIGWDIYERHMALKPNISFDQIYKEAERFGCSERSYRRVIAKLADLNLIENSSHKIKIKNKDKFYEFLINVGAVFDS